MLRRLQPPLVLVRKESKLPCAWVPLTFCRSAPVFSPICSRLGQRPRLRVVEVESHRRGNRLLVA